MKKLIISSLLLMFAIFAGFVLIKPPATASTAAARVTANTAGYTLVMKATLFGKTTEGAISQWSLVKQRTDAGAFVEQRTSYGKNGPVVITSFSDDQGRYLSHKEGDATLQQVGNYLGNHYDQAKFEQGLAQHPELRKENPIEYLVGLKTYVLTRVDASGYTHTRWVSPELGQAIKEEHIFPKHGQRSLIEPVLFIRTLSDPAAFERVPKNLPIVKKSGT